VYVSEADIEVAAALWERLTGDVVPPALLEQGHLDDHPHGTGGMRTLPGGIAHTGHQVDVSKRQRLLTISIRLAAVDTPFRWAPPVGEPVVVSAPPGSITVSDRLAQGQMSASLADAPGLSLHRRRMHHGVPAVTGMPTFLSDMEQWVVEADSPEAAVALVVEVVAAATLQFAELLAAEGGGGRGGASGSRPQPLPLGFAYGLMAFQKERGDARLSEMWGEACPGQPQPWTWSRACSLRVVFAYWVYTSGEGAAEIVRRAAAAALGEAESQHR
jgi:hypothetical protein